MATEKQYVTQTIGYADGKNNMSQKPYQDAVQCNHYSNICLIIVCIFEEEKAQWFKPNACTCHVYGGGRTRHPICNYFAWDCALIHSFKKTQIFTYLVTYIVVGL